MYPLHNWAQDVPGYSQKDLVKSYIESKHVFYTFEEEGTPAYLSNMEKMNIKSERTEMAVKVFDTERGLIREIDYLKPPKLPEWMKIPGKVILSDVGAWSMDSEGELIAYTANNSSIPDQANQDVQLFNYYIRNFIPFQKLDLERISLPNTSIEEIKAGVYSIRNGGSSILYDTKKLVIHTEVNDDLGNLKSERSKFFARTRMGGIYPTKEMAKHYLLTRKDQKPYYRIEVIEYSDYHVLEKGESRSSQNTPGSDFMAPNIIHTIVQNEITIGGANQTQGEFRVKITDMTGRLILERNYDNPANRLSISLDKILPGMYACMMISDDQVVTEKFIVQ